MQLPPRLAKILHAIVFGQVASGFFGIFMGRNTFFALVFSVAGVYGWLKLGRDLTSFAIFAGAMQSLIWAKSVSEDYNNQKIAQQQSTNIVNNIQVPLNTPPATPASLATQGVDPSTAQTPNKGAGEFEI